MIDHGLLRSRAGLGSVLAILAVTLVSAAGVRPGWAAEEQSKKGGVGRFEHTGTVVKAESGKLAMTIGGALPHVHQVAPDAEVTLDGKPAKLGDLQQGDRVRVVSQVRLRPVAGRPSLSFDGPAVQIKATRPQQPKKPAKEQSKVALGVAVAPSPDGSPLVVAVAGDSPAEAAGIQQGDYITAVDGKKIASPEALQKAIAKKEPGQSAKLEIWRAGAKESLQVKFPGKGKAASGEDAKLAKKPWVGLMLQTADEEPGASVARIYLGSPAAEAGLKPGDRIVQVDGQSVDSPRQAAQYIRKLSPGQEAQFAVVRDGGKKQLTVQVGNLSDFHERLFGENFRRRYNRKLWMRT